MNEFFVWANSFAAPFFSDTDTYFVEAETADDALTKARDGYKHPSGLYAMNVYATADAFHKRHDPLARYLHPLADVQSNGIVCHCGQRARLSMTTPTGEMHFSCGEHETIKQRSEYIEADMG